MGPLTNRSEKDESGGREGCSHTGLFERTECNGVVVTIIVTSGWVGGLAYLVRIYLYTRWAILAQVSQLAKLRKLKARAAPLGRAQHVFRTNTGRSV